MSDQTPPEDTTPETSPPGGPFAVDPVDPLVFTTPTDSPELRPAASYVSVGPQLAARAPKPVTPTERSYPAWTPGGLPADPPPTTPTPNDHNVPTPVRVIALLTAIAGPLLLLALVLLYASRSL